MFRSERMVREKEQMQQQKRLIDLHRSSRVPRPSGGCSRRAWLIALGASATAPWRMVRTVLGLCIWQTISIERSMPASNT